MSKVAALKEKLKSIQASLAEKTDKIAFIKAWKEKRAKAAAAPPKAADPHSLNAIYRDGSTGTRLQVIAFYIFVIVSLVSAGSMVKKVLSKMRSSTEHEKLVGDISHGLADIKHKAEERTEMVALGQFTTNVYVGPPEDTKMMNVDLWVRVSDPEAAAQVNNRNEVFRDKTMDALNELFVKKVNLMREDGKAQAKMKIRELLNSALKKGKVEEVFIQNLVAE